MTDDLVGEAFRDFSAWLEQRRHNREIERLQTTSQRAMIAAPPPADPGEALRRKLQEQRDGLAKKLGMTK